MYIIVVINNIINNIISHKGNILNMLPYLNMTYFTLKYLKVT